VQRFKPDAVDESGRYWTRLDGDLMVQVENRAVGDRLVIVTAGTASQQDNQTDAREPTTGGQP
jgi:hypothetical protein